MLLHDTKGLLASLFTQARAALSAVLACLALQAQAASPAIRIVSEEFPPYNMTEKGKFTGFSTEVVEAVLAEIGVQAAIQSMPWARAYEIAQKSENVLIYSIVRTPEREKLFKWVGVVAPSDWSLFARRDTGIKLASLEDAKRFQIGTVNKDAGEEFLVSKGFVVGKNLQSSNKYESNYEKLMRGRVDLVVGSNLVAAYIVRHSGDNPDMVLDKVMPLPELGGDGFYMAFSPTTSDTVVNLFKSGLDTVKKNGKYEMLRKKWL